MGIRKIAELANVSTTTVSRVLNHPQKVKKHTRDKILRIIKELNYHKYHSSYVPKKNKDEIAVILPDICNSFFARILEGVVRKSKELHLKVSLYLTYDEIQEELDAVKMVAQEGLRGVVLIRCVDGESDSLKSVKYLNKMGIPFVLVDRDIENSHSSGVFLSNANGVYDGISLLLNDGYKNIYIIGGPKSNLNSNQRINGYKEAFLNHGLIPSNDCIYSSDFSLESGYEAGKKILSQKKFPEAIFSINNTITLGCMQAIKENGLVVGKDIKLFSFNKLEEGYGNNFDISYINHPAGKMGERGVAILNNMFVGTKGLIREIVDYTICY